MTHLSNENSLGSGDDEAATLLNVSEAHIKDLLHSTHSLAANDFLGLGLDGHVLEASEGDTVGWVVEGIRSIYGEDGAIGRTMEGDIDVVDSKGVYAKRR